MLVVVLPCEAEILQNPLNTKEHTVHRGKSKIINYPVKNKAPDLSQFRCWQQGQLIIDEVNFIPLDPSSLLLLKQGNTKLRAYDYGETFCLFIGE